MKVIELVILMCHQCPFFCEEDVAWCSNFSNRVLELSDETGHYEIPDWCPLENADETDQ
jgi:hypothetical protein